MGVGSAIAKGGKGIYNAGSTAAGAGKAVAGAVGKRVMNVINTPVNVSVKNDQSSRFSSYDFAAWIALAVFLLDIFYWKYLGYDFRPLVGSSWSILVFKLALDGVLIFIFLYVIVAKTFGEKSNIVIMPIVILIYVAFSYYLKESTGLGVTFYSVWDFPVMVLLGVYYAFNQPDSKNALSIGLMWFFLVNVLALGVLKDMMGIAHIFLGIIIYFLAISPKFKDNPSGGRYLFIFLMFMDLFSVALIKKFVTTNDVYLIPYMIPLYLWISTIYAVQEQAHWTTRLILIGLVVYTFGYGTLVGGQSLGLIATPKFMTAEQQDNVKGYLNIVDTFQRMKNNTDRAMLIGSGYSAEVDENSKKKLGVYLEYLPDQYQYYSDDRVILDATLTAQNFQTDVQDIVFEPIMIELSCAAYKDNKEYAKGIVAPEQTIRVDMFDKTAVQCYFEPWQLEKGSYDIRFSAKFNFRTEAYMKRYFVLRDKIDALRRKQMITDETEILALNKITDADPQMKNSVGPIEIRANDRIPPIIKLDNARDTKIVYGIQLANAWEGKIDRVKNIRIYLPIGMTIEEGTCKYAMMESSPDDYEKYEGYYLYQLMDINNPSLRRIDKDMTQSCTITIKSSSINNLLDPGEITTRYLRFNADYDYIIKASESINVVDQEGYNIKITSAEKQRPNPINSSSQKVRCTLTSDQRMDNKMIFKLYVENNERSVSEPVLCADEYCYYDFTGPFDRDTHLKCEAYTASSNVPENLTALAYTIVKNSPPILEVNFSKKEVLKGEPLTCDAVVIDTDYDNIAAEFIFEGVSLATAIMQCPGSCSAEIPTEFIEENSQIRCTVKAMDNYDTVEVTDTALIKKEEKKP